MTINIDKKFILTVVLAVIAVYGVKQYGKYKYWQGVREFAQFLATNNSAPMSDKTD